ncbi:MAG: hypothetical protein NZ739_00485 [Verrucomicrobiae bacterium]|nr:hypothetical protein [Verrucomicrobiae bacterium]MCX7722595.1 hypothetical protein [Verrucomicrobiae bacterium]MDW7980342.1 hypothetical protein [Verrucomicrobiales bacterium]
MGLLKLFSKRPVTPLKLPTGSFTVDKHGRVVVSTVPQSFPMELQREIGECVLKCFVGAQQANLPLNELRVNYAGFRVVARYMRGAAIVFLNPVTPMDPGKSQT